jgi:DNA-binding response OmpR family regulator
MTSVQERIDFFIIEDDVSTYTLLSSYIISKGYSCVHAGSVSSAFRMLDTTIPVIILLDVMLPDQNGYELIKPVQGDPRLKDVVIYFLTAIHKYDALELVEKFGVEGVILKPFNLNEFNILFEMIEMRR